jgi:hypothetical protein
MGEEMETSIYEHIPLKDENAEMLGKEVKNMVLSNAVGIPCHCYSARCGCVNWLSYIRR